MINEKLSKNLAKNISSLRGQRSLSQRALAILSGLPRSTVTQIESGSANPTLFNLAQLASSLQVSIEELIAKPHESTQLIQEQDLLTKNKGAVLITDLLPDPIPGMEISRMEFAGGARLKGIPHLPGTKEYITVIKGRIEMQFETNSYVIKSGDLLSFPAQQKHLYVNPDKSQAVLFSVVALSE